MLLLNRKIVHIGAVVVLGLLVYLNTLHAPFLWDDANFAVDTPQMKNLANFLDLDLANKSFGRRYFGYLTFALNYRLHGLSVAGYHLVNIAIHLLASLLVYRLVSLTFQTPYFQDSRRDGAVNPRAGFIALLAALLFVAHPLQTQAVTYVVQRFASLAAMFYLLSLTSYVRGRLVQNAPGSSPFAAAAWFAAALASAALAMKTKETAFTLPLSVVLYELLFFTGKLKKKVAALVLALVVLIGCVAAFSSVFSGRSFGEIVSNLDRATRLQTDMSRWDYLATECRVIVTYLRLLLFPVGQRIDYDYPLYHSFLDPAVLLSGALLCSLLGAAGYCLWLSRRKDDDRTVLLRVVAFGIFWFFVTLLVESSIIPIIDVIFEHRTYLPSVGFYTAVAALVSYLGGADARLPGWPQRRVMAGAAAVLLVLAGMTVARNQLWRDEVAFWEDNAWKSPQKGRAFINLARAREKNGDPDGALVAYRRASELDPYHTDSLLNRGLMLIQKGQFADALVQFQTALAIDPKLAEAHNNIGKLYGMHMRHEEALREFQQAVKLKPTLAEPYNNIGYVYYLQRRYPEALQEFEKCLARNPDYELAYVNRGMTLMAIGRTGEALADFRKALEINPSNAEAATQLQQTQNPR